MGTLGKRDAPKEAFTEESVQRYLYQRKPLLSNPLYEALNMFLYGWESDYLAISRNGYVYEAEIKISRSDFHADLKKPKHALFANPSSEPVPNYFYYICPDGVITEEDLVDVPYAGLVYVQPGGWFNHVTGATRLHEGKCPFGDAALAEKFHFGMWNFIKRYWSKGTVDISAATRKRYEDRLMEYDDMLSEKDGEVWELKQRIKTLEDLLKKSPVAL